MYTWSVLIALTRETRSTPAPAVSGDPSGIQVNHTCCCFSSNWMLLCKCCCCVVPETLFPRRWPSGSRRTCGSSPASPTPRKPPASQVHLHPRYTCLPGTYLPPRYTCLPGTLVYTCLPSTLASQVHLSPRPPRYTCLPGTLVRYT